MIKWNELCELLGIKRTYFISAQRDGEEKYVTEDFYPDFTQPENFVKLLELEMNNGYSLVFEEEGKEIMEGGE